MHTFLTGTAKGKKWYNGVVYFFEFELDGTRYLAGSRSEDFGKAIAIELVPGLGLNQLRELEEIVLSD
jgi:hypothetical protein